MSVIFNPTPAVIHLQQADPTLNYIISAVGDCTLQPSNKGFPTLVEAIISQQISVKAAETITARLISFLGTLSPDAILAHSIDELRGIGLSRQKALYLLDLAGHIADGRLVLDDLSAQPDEAIISSLIHVRGIGRWTAEMYLIFALGRLDVLPVDDLGLRQAIQRMYRQETIPHANAIRHLAQPWQPYRSIATWYLWQSQRLQTPMM